MNRTWKSITKGKDQENNKRGRKLVTKDKKENPVDVEHTVTDKRAQLHMKG